MHAPSPELPAFLDRRPIIWSYSLLNCFRSICPHQGEARYITKTIKFIETPETKWGNEVHGAFEYRVGGAKPLPANMRQWERFAAPFDRRGALVEQWLGITAEGKACDSRSFNVFGRGKLDLVLLSDTQAYLTDWKTGKSTYEDPFELEVGALLLHAKYPQLQKITGNYIWLKEDRVGQRYDLSDTRKTWNEVCSLMQTIYNYRKLGEFPKRKSGLCGYCQRLDCEENPNADARG